MMIRMNDDTDEDCHDNCPHSILCITNAASQEIMMSIKIMIIMTSHFRGWSKNSNTPCFLFGLTW